MAFDGSEGGLIPLELASVMTATYREENPNGILAHFFGRDILIELLRQEGCVGIRMYYGIDNDGAQQLVIVGVDESENDMLEMVADLSSPCPTICGAANKLNS